MTRLEALLNKGFEELTNEELVELKTLLVKSGIEVDAIDEVTFETIKTFFKEEDVMKNETAATTNTNNEEIKMGELAKAFAEASKEKLTNGFKFVVENVDVAKEEVSKMANMNDAQLEAYLKDNGKSVLDKIVDAVKKYSGKMKDGAELFPSLKENAEKSDNIIELIKDVLDEKELSGWGKIKSIVKELICWLLRLFFKVGAIVLKLAVTVIVGAVKVGAITLVTTGKLLKVANNDIVKPSIKAGKKALKSVKEKLDSVTKADDDLDLNDLDLFEEDEDYDDIEAELFEQ